MDKKLLLAMLVFGLLVTSCATVRRWRANYQEPEWMTQIKAYNANPKHKNKIICDRRTPTGSHIPRWHCETAHQREYWRMRMRMEI